MSKTDKAINLSCELCGKSRGVTIKLGELAERIPGLDKTKTEYLQGMCEKCEGELKEGCTFFIDADHRVMKVSLEATRTKIAKEFWGRVVKIPKAAMDHLIATWAAHQPPSSTS